tara:strand:+ start:2555 stop:2917 length:363 start_codon:yes stop_codon:yes gene_type:complete
MLAKIEKSVDVKLPENLLSEGFMKKWFVRFGLNNFLKNHVDYCIVCIFQGFSFTNFKCGSLFFVVLKIIFFNFSFEVLMRFCHRFASHFGKITPDIACLQGKSSVQFFQLVEEVKKTGLD